MLDGPTRGVMIVDDDIDLLETLASILREEVEGIETCADVRAALESLNRWTPDLLLLDVAMPDGDAFDVLDAVERSRRPTPLVIAMSGAASPEQSFRLAKRGVTIYLTKPFGIDDLLSAIDRAAREPEDLRPQIRTAVGKRPLRELESEVRETMLEEALARADGNRRGAARLLNISRQLVQHMVRRRTR